LKVLAIGVKENADQASSWSSQHQLTYPIMIDPNGEIYNNYGNGSVPYHVLIDRGFKIIHSQENFQKELLIGKIQDL
jgi:peroxiredoxin